MLIYYDSEFSNELTEKLRLKFMETIEERDRVHLSDTAHCPVKAWCRIIGLKPLINDRTIGIMMIGMVGQTIFQELYPPEWTEFEPDLNLPEDMQTPSHIDIFLQEPERTFPIEIKWSRRNVTRGGELSKSWIVQTTGYMAKTNSREGKLVIFNIMNGKIHVFKFLMTDEELEMRRNEIDACKENIEEAVREKDANLLIIWEDECKFCDYRPSRARTKEELGPACPRYKGATAPVPYIF